MENKDGNAFVPVMSATAARYITDTLLERTNLRKPYFIFEYGAGRSTKFFTDRLIERRIAANYVAVERDPQWYAEIRKLFPRGRLTKHPRPLGDYFRFIRSKPHNVWDVPEACRRLAGEQRKMRSPKNVLALVFRNGNFWFDASYHATMDRLQFECVYVFEGFKDQYGESPHKYRYMRIPLERLKRALESKQECHAAVIIDGGPRADIVKDFFSLIDTYKNLTVDMFLLEAYRGYYQPILSSRPGGRFIAAEKNEMADGRPYLEETALEKNTPCAALLGAPSVRDALARELWHYANIA